MTCFKVTRLFKIGKYNLAFIEAYDERGYKTFSVTIDDDCNAEVYKEWRFNSEEDAEAQFVRMVEMCEITTESEAVEIAC